MEWSCVKTEARNRLRRLVAVPALLLAACRADAPPVATGFADEASPEALVAVVQEMLPSIERLSGLDRTDVLRMRFQSREAAREYVLRRLETEMPPERLEAVRRTYVALGLLPDTLDLRALLLDLYTEQVLGYYDPAARTLYIIEGEDPEALRPVIAHELVHALQDQHTNLDSLIAWERGNDRQSAAHAAMEGHAMVVMFAVLAETATRRRVDPVRMPNPADELGPALAAQNEQFPVFQQAPRVIRETLVFPYVHGADFVHRLWSSMAGQARYPAPLDTLLPQSTAQVLQPERNFIERRVEPVELRADAAPPGYSTVVENTLGQHETAIFLAEHLGEAARVTAQGWAGDRFVLLADAQGRDVLHWASVWQDAAAADDFAAAVQRAGAARGRTVRVQRRDIDGRPAVVVVDAPAALADAALDSIPFRVQQ